MFTGIIRHVGEVRSLVPASGGRRLGIDVGPLAKGLSLGDSIAVSGACLTATEISGSVVQFDVIAETLNRTTLGDFRVGRKVNLERALTLGQGLDGHIVQGHVDDKANLKATRRAAGQCTLEFTAGRDLTDLMVAKGSVAIDGVSLTLVDVSAEMFSVGLIPTTLDETTLARLAPGQAVNIETDIIGRYVRKFLGGQSSAGITMEKLRQAGF